MSEAEARAGDSPTSETTRPVQGRPPAVPPSDTEALPGRPDLAQAAVLGPLADGSRTRRRLADYWGRGWNRVAIAAVMGVVVVLLATSFASSLRPDTAEVPDVRGMAYEGAQTLLRRAGFNADRVSFAPADESQAGAVLETIPGPGEDVEVGSGVHIVAGAAPVTPAPSIAPVNEGREERGENGRGNGRKDKDDD